MESEGGMGFFDSFIVEGGREFFNSPSVALLFSVAGYSRLRFALVLRQPLSTVPVYEKCKLSGEEVAVAQQSYC